MPAHVSMLKDHAPCADACVSPQDNRRTLGEEQRRPDQNRQRTISSEKLPLTENLSALNYGLTMPGLEIVEASIQIICQTLHEHLNRERV